MARDKSEIVRTADICDNHRDDARIVELQFRDFAARDHFHGTVETFETHEDNKGLRDLLAKGGGGKVLVIDGRGSMRRALCGGNVAAEAVEYGWEGLVFNGCVRDGHEIEVLDIGVKALGSTAMPPRHDGIGRAYVPVSFGNVTIRPGDYLYADRDGVIVLDAPDHG